MTDSKHTPGPWELDTDEAWPDVKVYADNLQFRVAIITDYADGVDKEQDKQMRAEQAANARLIAAAPELLAALEELVERLETLEHDHRVKHIGCSAARAAIARARGDK